jgi:hypothetical protein
VSDVVDTRDLNADEYGLWDWLPGFHETGNSTNCVGAPALMPPAASAMRALRPFFCEINYPLTEPHSQFFAAPIRPRHGSSVMSSGLSPKN